MYNNFIKTVVFVFFTSFVYAGEGDIFPQREPIAPIGITGDTNVVTRSLAPVPITNPIDFKELALALDIKNDQIVSSTIGKSDSKAFGISDDSIGMGYPISGNSFVIMSTGYAATATEPNNSGSTSTFLAGQDNSQGNDMVQWGACA